MDLNFDSPYYAAVVLAVATAAALVAAAVSGHRGSHPAVGVPLWFTGLFVGAGPAFLGALNDGRTPGTDLMLGVLAGFGIGVVTGLAIVIPLTLHWARLNRH